MFTLPQLCLAISLFLASSLSTYCREYFALITIFSHCKVFGTHAFICQHFKLYLVAVFSDTKNLDFTTIITLLTFIVFLKCCLRTSQRFNEINTLMLAIKVEEFFLFIQSSSSDTNKAVKILGVVPCRKLCPTTELDLLFQNVFVFFSARCTSQYRNLIVLSVKFIQQGMLTIFPQCNSSLEFPEVLSQHLSAITD